MKLYWCPQTRSSRAVWMLEEAGVDYELVHCDITKPERTPEHLAASPMGKVPALEDGEVKMWDSAAICLYVADRYASGRLAPALDDPGARPLRPLADLLVGDDRAGDVRVGPADRRAGGTPGGGVQPRPAGLGAVSPGRSRSGSRAWAKARGFSATSSAPADVMLGSSAVFLRMFGMLPESPVARGLRRPLRWPGRRSRRRRRRRFPAEQPMSEAGDPTVRGGPIAFMASNPIAANLLMVFLLLAGLLAAGELVQEMLPDASLDRVQVMVPYPGAAPAGGPMKRSSARSRRSSGLWTASSGSRPQPPKGSDRSPPSSRAARTIDRALNDAKARVDRIPSFPRGSRTARGARRVTSRQSGHSPPGSRRRAGTDAQGAGRTTSRTASRRFPKCPTWTPAAYREYEISIEVPSHRLRALGAHAG